MIRGFPRKCYFQHCPMELRLLASPESVPVSKDANTGGGSEKKSASKEPLSFSILSTTREP